MALKTQGKLMVLGPATSATAAARSLQVQRQSPDSKDCPFAHDRPPAGPGTDSDGGNV